MCSAKITPVHDLYITVYVVAIRSSYEETDCAGLVYKHCLKFLNIRNY